MKAGERDRVTALRLVLSELQKLQDTVRPMPAGAAQAIVKRELGAPVEEVFTRFAPDPLGSANDLCALGLIADAAANRGTLRTSLAAAGDGTNVSAATRWSMHSTAAVVSE